MVPAAPGPSAPLFSEAIDPCAARLHDIEGLMIVPNREQRLFIGAALDLREEIGKFGASSQTQMPYCQSEERSCSPLPSAVASRRGWHES